MTAPNSENSTDPVQHAVRRQAGIAALRQLRRMVDAEQAEQEANRRFVPRFLQAFVVLALCALLGWLWFRGVI